MRAHLCCEKRLRVEPTQTAVKGAVDDPTDELRVEREREIRTVSAGTANLEEILVAHFVDARPNPLKRVHLIDQIIALVLDCTAANRVVQVVELPWTQ